MSTFLTLTVNGLSLAALLFLVAAGLSLIFGLMGVMNFAHGSFFLIGAYTWLEVMQRTKTFWIALLVALIAGALVGAISERVLIRPLYQRPLSQILVTLGLGLVLNQLVIAVWGPNPQFFVDIPGLTGSLRMGDISITRYRIFAVVVGAVVLIGVWALLRYTRLGLIVRAGVENPTMVGALGMNVSLVFLGVFALGAALAALGGVSFALYTGSLTVDMGQNMLLSAIIVVVLGGLGSYVGSAVGALVIGLAQDYVPYYALQLESNHLLPSGVYSSAASLISLFLLVVILLVRPQGLMGIKVENGGL
ncbi:MAG: branched-chain amino acid ABC transporter permease [Chloroflexota bacterium]